MSHAMPLRPALALSALLGLIACADAGNTPASQRGFIDGLAAMVTGGDEQRARGLEKSATDAEVDANRRREDATTAANHAAITSGMVQAAEQRMAELDRTLSEQRERLNRMRGQGRATPAATAEVSRLDQQAAQIQRDARAAAGQVGGATPAQTRQLEERTQALRNSMDQLSRSM